MSFGVLYLLCSKSVNWLLAALECPLMQKGSGFKLDVVKAKINEVMRAL